MIPLPKPYIAPDTLIYADFLRVVRKWRNFRGVTVVSSATITQEYQQDKKNC